MLSNSCWGKSGLITSNGTVTALLTESVRHAATKKGGAGNKSKATMSTKTKTKPKAAAPKAKSVSPAKAPTKSGKKEPVSAQATGGSKKHSASPSRPKKLATALVAGNKSTMEEASENIITKMDSLFLGRSDPEHPTTILTAGWRTVHGDTVNPFALDTKLSQTMQKKYPHMVKITNPKTGKVTLTPTLLGLNASAGGVQHPTVGLYHPDSGTSHAITPGADAGSADKVKSWMSLSAVGSADVTTLLVPLHADGAVTDFLSGKDLEDAFITLPSVQRLVQELADCHLLKPKQLLDFHKSFAHFTDLKNIRAELPQVISTRENMRLLANAPEELRMEVEAAAGKVMAKKSYELLKHTYGLVPKGHHPDVGAAIQAMKQSGAKVNEKEEGDEEGVRQLDEDSPAIRTENSSVIEDAATEARRAVAAAMNSSEPTLGSNLKTFRPNLPPLGPEEDNLSYLDSMFLSPGRLEAEAIAAQGLLTRFAVLRVVDRKNSSHQQQSNRRFDGRWVQQVELYLYDRASSNAEFRSFDAPAEITADGSSRFKLPQNFFAGVDTLIGIDLREQLSKIWYDGEVQRFLKDDGKIWCLSYADYLLHCFRNSRDIEDVLGRKADGTNLFENVSIKSMVDSADGWFTGGSIDAEGEKKEKKLDVETAVKVLNDPEPHAEKTRTWARLFLVNCCQYVFQLQVMRSVQMRSTRTTVARMDGCLCTTEMESNGLFIVTGAKCDPLDDGGADQDFQNNSAESSSQHSLSEWSVDQRVLYDANALLRANLPTNLLPWQREDWSWSNVNHLSHYYYGTELSSEVGNCRKDGVVKFTPDAPKTPEEKKKIAEAKANAEAIGEVYEGEKEEIEYDPAQLVTQPWLSTNGGRPFTPLAEDTMINVQSRGFSFESARVELLFHAANKDLMSELVQSPTVSKTLHNYTTKALGLDGSNNTPPPTTTVPTNSGSGSTMTMSHLGRAVRENVSSAVGSAPLLNGAHHSGVQEVADHLLVSATTKLLFVSVKVCPQTLHVYEISVFDPDLANADGTSAQYHKTTDIAAFKRAKAAGTLNLSAADLKKRPSFKAFINAPKNTDPETMYQKSATTALSAGYWTSFQASHYENKFESLDDALKNLEGWCANNLGMDSRQRGTSSSSDNSEESASAQKCQQHPASCIHRTLIVSPPLELQRVVGSGVELAISNGYRCPSVVPINSKVLQQTVNPPEEVTRAVTFDFAADFEDLEVSCDNKSKPNPLIAAEHEWRKYYDAKKHSLKKKCTAQVAEGGDKKDDEDASSSSPSGSVAVNRDTLLDDIASIVTSDFARTALTTVTSSTTHLKTALKPSVGNNDAIGILKDYSPIQVAEIIRLWNAVPQLKTKVTMTDLIARKGDEHFDVETALMKVRGAIAYFAWCGILTQERLMKEVKSCFEAAAATAAGGGEAGGASSRDYNGVLPSTFPRGGTAEPYLKDFVTERGDLVAPKILTLRKQNKLGEAVVQFENAFTMTNDGLVHQYLHHSKTITGRLSSTAPNSQSIPKDKKIRRLLMSRYLPPSKPAAAGTPPPPAHAQLQGAQLQHPFHNNFISGVIEDKLHTLSAKAGGVEGSTSQFQRGVVLEFDYSQLEVITLAALTGDSHMDSDLTNKVDFHVKRATVINPRFTYDELFKKAKVEKVPEFVTMRDQAKVFSFQSIYGAGAQAISKQTGLTLDQVKTLKLMEAKMYPTVPRLYRAVVESVERGTETPGLTTNTQAVKLFSQFLDEDVQRLYRATTMYEDKGTMYGVFPLPTGSSVAFHNQGVVTQVSIDTPVVKNYPIQSLAGEVVQIALGKVFRHVLAKDSYKGKLVLTNTVHDSIWVDCEASIAEEVAKDFKDILSSVPAFLQEIWLGTDNKENSTGGVKAPRIPDFPVDVMVGPDMARLKGLDTWLESRNKNSSTV